ncbi:flagellar export chaperone FliS [Saccharobesus litoralis]|uniref:Flagellar secretion chaperone FliS n=1 Tax=Saccharobesus litoralis TaxID=2172099 RepID=A0A2S0VUA7_9ALTE|nr:flagellar export chaperone FliS [Saccharobesus litoralis]AWB67798.1 flagellar export chaperone FliS [Saccharobesus litoralis]
MYRKGINAYKKGNLKQEVALADPHKLTLMLMQGALDKIAYAKGCMERKEFEGKAEHLSKANAILVNLRDTIDLDAGGEVGDNLFALYDYMIGRLTDAHIQNNLQILEEVINLMLPIKNAWAQIPESAKQEAYQAQREKQQAAV